MALETGTYIDDLVATNPTGADDRSTADDHLRLIKALIKASFPNINGAMTATQVELNLLDGYTGNTDDFNLLAGAAAAGLTSTELNQLNGYLGSVVHLNYINSLTSNAQIQLNTKAFLASPAFTGNPTAPTASVGDNDTSIANTAHVQTALTADNDLRKQLETISSLQILRPTRMVGVNTATARLEMYEIVSFSVSTSGRTRNVDYTPCIKHINTNVIGSIVSVNNTTASAITLNLTYSIQEVGDDTMTIRTKVNGSVSHTTGNLSGLGFDGETSLSVSIPASTDCEITIDGRVGSGSGSDDFYFNGVLKARLEF